MTDLLKRWAQHEPERCAFWTEFDNPMCRVFVNRTDVASYELEFRPMLLAAVIEAIEAHRWEWTLSGGGCLHQARVINADDEHGCVASIPTDPPALPLLGAYLFALEAQARA